MKFTASLLGFISAISTTNLPPISEPKHAPKSYRLSKADDVEKTKVKDPYLFDISVMSILLIKESGYHNTVLEASKNGLLLGNIVRAARNMTIDADAMLCKARSFLNHMLAILDEEPKITSEELRSRAMSVIYNEIGFSKVLKEVDTKGIFKHFKMLYSCLITPPEPTMGWMGAFYHLIENQLNYKNMNLRGIPSPDDAANFDRKAFNVLFARLLNEEDHAAYYNIVNRMYRFDIKKCAAFLNAVTCGVVDERLLSAAYDFARAVFGLYQGRWCTCGC